MSHIDVMVPCYNYGRFLRQCVDSVLSQSHRDLRVVIVDDASTDETSAMCAHLTAQDARVAVVRHESNRGHIATYNECIDLAGDDYMLILSADDFLLPGALARAIEVLDRYPEVGLAYGRWCEYRSGDPLPAPASDPAKAEIVDTAWLVAKLAVGNHIGAATAVVRSTTQKKLGHYHRDLPHSGDLEMWLRFALNGKVAYIPQLQAAYRRHECNLSSTFDRVADLQQYLDAFLLHYAGIRRHVPNGTLVETRVRRLLARKQRKTAKHLLRQGKLGQALRLFVLSLRKTLDARLQEIRARLGLPEALSD